MSPRPPSLTPLALLALTIAACNPAAGAPTPTDPGPLARTGTAASISIQATAAILGTRLALAAASTATPQPAAATPVQAQPSPANVPTLEPAPPTQADGIGSGPASPAPTSDNQSAASPVPGGPQVLSFTVSPAVVNPGDPITFAWSTVNGANLHISQYASNGLPGSGWSDLPAAGTLTAVTAPDARDTYHFQLEVVDANGVLVRGPYTPLRFHCPYTYFFSATPDPEPCPDGPPETIQLVTQAFEGGWMVWRAYTSTDAGITVLFPDGSFWNAQDTWAAPQPETDPSLQPPPGRFQPVRGFGKVWRTEAGLRERLGWALGPEQPAQTPYQRILERPRHKGWVEFYRLADGRVLRLDGDTYGGAHWEFVTP